LDAALTNCGVGPGKQFPSGGNLFLIGPESIRYFDLSKLMLIGGRLENTDTFGREFLQVSTD
jgi:hypothetical protein